MILVRVIALALVLVLVLGILWSQGVAARPCAV
jgi:hypothetical protein